MRGPLPVRSAFSSPDSFIYPCCNCICMEMFSMWLSHSLNLAAPPRTRILLITKLSFKRNARHVLHKHLGIYSFFYFSPNSLASAMRRAEEEFLHLQPRTACISMIEHESHNLTNKTWQKWVQLATFSMNPKCTQALPAMLCGMWIFYLVQAWYPHIHSCCYSCCLFVIATIVLCIQVDNIIGLT